MRIRGVDLFVEEKGEGPAVVFSHGLLWSGEMFRAQVEALSDRYRCITYDHRGQGRSEMPPERTIEIETVYEDAVALIEKLDVAPCHFVGLSMGGFVGIRLAARRPDLLRSVVLMDTAADAEPTDNVGRYRMLNLVTRLGGLPLVAGQVVPIMFGKTFLEDPARASLREEWIGKLKALPRRVYRATNGVISRRSVEQELSKIEIPTLVLHGEEDVAIARPRCDRLVDGISGAKLVTIPRAGHTATVEEPDAVNAALAEFLDAHG